MYAGIDNGCSDQSFSSFMIFFVCKLGVSSHGKDCGLLVHWRAASVEQEKLRRCVLGRRRASVAGVLCDVTVYLSLAVLRTFLFFLQAFSAQAAVAIANSRLYHETKKSLNHALREQRNLKFLLAFTRRKQRFRNSFRGWFVTWSVAVCAQSCS